LLIVVMVPLAKWEFVCSNADKGGWTRIYA
jgi:hypothetical protein